MNYKWPLLTGLFVSVSAFYVVLAWDGDNYTLVALGVTSVFLAFMVSLFGAGSARALDGWGRSTVGWAASQAWGMELDAILRDAISDLQDYDTEAAKIHAGRSVMSSVAYIKTFYNLTEKEEEEWKSSRLLSTK